MGATWEAEGIAAESGQPLAGLLRGTHIMTRRGETPVEALLAGGRVLTQAGQERRIAWIGRRLIQPHRHPHPHWVAPVRIRRGAIANGLPRRDLIVSPALLLALEGVTVPVQALVNGATILARPGVDSAEYFALALDEPDLLQAEGLAVESHRDRNNRCTFANAGPVMRLHPDAPSPREADLDVQYVRGRLLDRAQALGHALTRAAELHLRTGDRRLAPSVAGGPIYRFILPLEATDVCIVSHAGVPAEMVAESADRRRLGVLIERLVLRGPPGASAIPLEHPMLSEGFHPPERYGGSVLRWTDGHARLPAPLLEGATALEVHIAGFQPTWAGTAPPAAPAVWGG